jgi:hypothetical protein
MLVIDEAYFDHVFHGLRTTEAAGDRSISRVFSISRTGQMFTFAGTDRSPLASVVVSIGIDDP